MHSNAHKQPHPGIAMHLGGALAPLALLLAISPVQAAGLGGYEVQSWLGQPLRMAVQITARADEVVEARCFKLYPYTVANDGLPQLTGAQLTLDKRGDQQRLIISSARPILDPIVRVSIDIGCDTTSLRRDLTLLLDPQPQIETTAEAAAPANQAGTPVAPSAPPPSSAAADEAARAATTGGPASGAGSASTSAAAATPRASGAAARATPRQEPRQSSAASATKAPAQPRPPRTLKAADGQAQAQPRPRPPKTAAQHPRDRLTISTSGPPLESSAGAPITPRLMLSTTLTDRRGQPPLPENVLSILRQKQARLKAAPVEEDIPSMEAELVVLQKQTAEMRGQLNALMAQMASLRESAGSAGSGRAPAMQPAAGAVPPAATPVSSLPREEPEEPWSWRDPRLLIAILLGLFALLLLVAAASWLRRERIGSRRAARWNQTPYVPATAPPPPAPASRPVVVPREAANEVANEARPPIPESYTFSQYSAREAARELGVSDLAQATEKASVFVTLGRPEQAIDVLRDHIDHEAKPSPMAWLMLLDLYRQNGRRSEFLDISKRFHREFNAEIPAWDQTAPLHDSGLIAFPHLIHRIRDDWPKAGARAFIEELLYDNRGGSRIGFSLPAFRDLLLLHGIIDEYLAALEAPARTDPRTGAVMPPPEPPVPPPGLAEVWAAPTAKPPEFPPQTSLHLDMGLLSDSQERSALETGYPIIAEALTTRWAQPGVAEYLDKLIRSTDDTRGLALSNAAMAELIMLHDLALELAGPQPG